MNKGKKLTPSILWSEQEMDTIIAAAIREYGPPSTWQFTYYTIINRAQKIALTDPKRLRRLNSSISIGPRLTKRIDQWKETGGERPTAPFPDGALRTAQAAANKPPVQRQTPDQVEKAPSVVSAGPARWRGGASAAPPPTPVVPPIGPPAGPVAALPRAPVPAPATPPAAPIWPSTVQLSDMLSTFLAGVLVDTIKKAMVTQEVSTLLQALRTGVPPALPPTPAPAPAPTPVAPSAVWLPRPAPKHNPAPVGPDREVKTIVLMCGVRADQQAQFLTKFPNLHLKFWHEDKPNRGLEVLRNKAAGADIVVFKMEQTSHSAVAVVEKVCQKIRRVSGSMTSLTEMLETIK